MAWKKPSFYSTFFVGRYGATLGKMAAKFRVVNHDGSKVSYGKSFCRFLASHTLLNLLFFAAALVNTGCTKVAPNPRIIFPNAAINGQPARVCLDTGSEVAAVLTEAAARRAGGRFKPFPIATNNPPDEGLTDPMILTLGQEHFKAQFRTFRFDGGFDALIGWPAVRDRILVFDGAGRSVRAVKELPASTTGWLKLKVDSRSFNQLTLEDPRDERGASAVLVDSGSPVGVALPKARWEQWRATHPLASVSSYDEIGVDNQRRTVKAAHTDEIKLGPITLTDVQVSESSDTNADQDNFIGILGLGALARMELVVDAKHGAAYARPLPATGIAGTANQDWAVVGQLQIKSEAFIRSTVAYKLLAQDYDGAIADATRALELDPKDADAYFMRGGARDAKDDYEGAVNDYNRAVDLDPGNAAARLARAEIKLTHQDEAGIIADLDRVLELEPENGEALASRAEARQIQGDFAGALADYQTALKRGLDNSNYFRLYSQLLQLRMGAAPADFAQTIAGWNPGWAKSLARFVAGALGEKALLLAAEQRDQESVAGQKCEAYYFIGMMRFFKGDKAGAREYWEKCTASDEKECHDFYEFQFARAELARLDASPK